MWAAASLKTNLTATARDGTSVTASATPGEVGTWVDVVTAGATVTGFWLMVLNINANSVDTSALLGVRYDDDGAGTNAVDVIGAVTGASFTKALPVGAAPTVSGRGKATFHPYTIPSGKHVTVALQSVVVSEQCEVFLALQQSVQLLSAVAVPQFVGVDAANSRGTSTPLASGDFGAWTDLGALAADANIFRPTLDALDDTSLGNFNVVVQIGYGATAPDAGGTAITGEWWYVQGSTGDLIGGVYPQGFVYADLASGTHLWARIASGETGNRGVTIESAEATIASGGSTIVIGDY
jgi:hypothetical protein